MLYPNNVIRFFKKNISTNSWYFHLRHEEACCISNVKQFDCGYTELHGTQLPLKTNTPTFLALLTWGWVNSYPEIQLTYMVLWISFQISSFGKCEEQSLPLLSHNVISVVVHSCVMSKWLSPEKVPKDTDVILIRKLKGTSFREKVCRFVTCRRK